MVRRNLASRSLVSEDDAPQHGVGIAENLAEGAERHLAGAGPGCSDGHRKTAGFAQHQEQQAHAEIEPFLGGPPGEEERPFGRSGGSRRRYRTDASGRTTG